MMRYFQILIYLIFSIGLFGQFPPAAGETGSTAIHGDSSIFKSWANQCIVERGFIDISKPDLGLASVGESSLACGDLSQSGVVSLGDGGYATLSFDPPISNAEGWDFAVFENGFDNYFMELAFVEASSDGIHFFRFPATSHTQDSIQKGSFDSLDATQLNNLAGKYRAGFGVPFELDELADDAFLDKSKVHYIRVVDVVGCLQDQYATYDLNGNRVNDPWPTPFPSSGFDLDAVGVINQATVSNKPFQIHELTIGPNPVSDVLTINLDNFDNADLEYWIVNTAGQNVMHGYTNDILDFTINVSNLAAGVYTTRIKDSKSIKLARFIKLGI